LDEFDVRSIGSAAAGLNAVARLVAPDQTGAVVKAAAAVAADLVGIPSSC